MTAAPSPALWAEPADADAPRVRPARRVFGISRGQALAVTALAFPLTAVWGWSTYDPASGIGHVHLAPALAIAVLAQLWPVARTWRRADARRLGAAGVVLAATYALTGLPYGVSPTKTLVQGVVIVLLGVAFLAAYRRQTTCSEWFPSSGKRAHYLAVLCGLHSLGLVALGGVQAAGVGGTGTANLDLSWLAVCYANTYFALMFFFALAHPMRQYSTLQHAATLPIGAVVGPVCLVLSGVYPGFPLYWMVFIPAVWIAITLPRRLAVVASMSLPAVTYDLGRYPGNDDFVQADTILKILVMVISAWMVTAITAHREMQDRLIAGVDEVARTEAIQGQLLDAVIAALDDGVLLVTPDRRVLLSNPAARTMLGLAAVGEVQRDWLHDYDVRRQDGSPLTLQDMHAFLAPAPGADRRLTVSSTEPEGGERFYTVTARALAHRVEPMALIMLADSTAEHARQAELEAFAGDVAHDLKGPLTAIALWMDTAEAEAEGDVDAGRRALQWARQSSVRMCDTIDDCLAYTTTRAGLLRPRDLDLQAVVREVASGYEAAGATVDIAVDATVRADPTLVRRLLSNLIGNAVKYARPGQPAWVQVSTVPSEVPGWTRILVADRGIGIAEADAESVFQKFSRTARGSAAVEGTGLGLALCRSIVERHRGSIRATGNPWGGATIEFTLPEGRLLVRRPRRRVRRVRAAGWPDSAAPSLLIPPSSTPAEEFAMSQLPTLAVTGSTGAVGSLVARELAARGIALRLPVRDVGRAPRLAGAVPVPFSYADRAAAREALDGVRLLFMVSGAEAADRLDQHRTFIDAAAAARVEHVVYTSFVGAAPDATFTLARDHWATEEHLAASGMAWTFLRDNFYLDFLPDLVGEDGVIRGPAGDGRVAAVARADVARVAAAILAAPDAHAGRRYDLTGPEALTLTEVAAIVGRETGRPVVFHDETVPEAYESRRRWPAPSWQYDAWVSTYTAIAAGELDGVTDTVAQLTGRAPLTLTDYLHSRSL